MKNQRLDVIASLINSEDKVVDIGCDHGYLAIYLKKIKKCRNVIASDVNANALEVAKRNIAKENLTKKIPCLLSDGLENIPISEIDTVVIAGMGTYTILDILKNKKIEKIKKIILQSNKDYDVLRCEMQKRNYQMKEEIYIEENNHDYFIIEYQKGKQNLTELEIKYGIYKKENIPYYQKVLNQKKGIRKKLPWNKWKLKYQLKKEERELTNLIKQH